MMISVDLNLMNSSRKTLQLTHRNQVYGIGQGFRNKGNCKILFTIHFIEEHKIT